VAIITPGALPVPAVQGGAVESLVDSLIMQNEIFGQLDLEIVSVWDKAAELKSEQYKHTSFIYFTPPTLINNLDRIIYWSVKNILKIKKNMSYRYILQRLYFIYSTSKLLQKKEYDRIVFENHPTLFMTLKKNGNACKYHDKYFFHLHNEINSDFKCGHLIKNCKKILSVSNFINYSLSDKVEGISLEKFDVLRNCVDTERFKNNINQDKKNALKNEYGIKPNEKVVLFSGRLTPEKGIKELLLAFKNISTKNVKLVIVGGYFFASDTTSPFENELKIIADEIKNHVIFTGFIPYEKMQHFYAVADIAVLPSLCNDAAPLTVIEAMASGLPLITTNSGGIPEYADEQCAIILENKEGLIDKLTESIDRLLYDDALRERMSNSAKKATKDLNLENYYHEFINKMQPES
jgi:glycosyltransferase involved in cell wall biosynthesis